MSRAGGFTLIELMIVIAVATILLTVALPAYQDSVRKGRRAEAVAALTQLSQAQERYRASNTSYATTIASMPGSLPASTEHYTLGIAAAAAGSYTLTATAKSTSPQYADSKCRVLKLVSTAGGLTYQSTNAGGTDDPSDSSRCWPR